MAVKASAIITLSSVVDVLSTVRYYLLLPSTAATPSQPDTNPPTGSWSDTEPSYTPETTNTLYFVDLTVFSDSTFAYSSVSVSSSYEAAKQAYNNAIAAQGAASLAQATANAKADPMTATAHGGEIAVSDSAEAAIGGLVLYGRSEQGVQTTGKNLLPFEVNTPVAPNGVEINILPDGGVKIVGTTTALTTYMFHADYTVPNLPAGSYRFLLPGSGTGYGSSNILLQLYANTGSGMTSRLATVDGMYTIDSSVTADYVRLRIASGVTYDCVVYPMVMLSSETDTTFEPYTGAMPAPNPLFPSLIHSAGMTLGKNLLQFVREGSMTTGGMTFTPLEDGGLHISGTASATTQYNPYTDFTILNIPHGMYRIRISGTGTGAENVRVQMYEDRGSGLVVASAWNNEDYICIVRDDVVANTIRIRVSAGTYDCVVYPMVLPAYTDDTSFEGYTNGPVGTQIVLTCADDAQGTNAAHTILPTPNGLPGIAVSSGGNYTDEDGQQWICDTIDLAAGTYTRRVGQYTFDGTENWGTATLSSSVDSSKRRFTFSGLASMLMPPTSNSDLALMICDCYPVRSVSAADGIFYGYQGIAVAASGAVTVYDETYGNASGLADWEAMLAANPMHCLFALATPVTTPLTEAQLTALRSIRTRDGTTVLTNDAGADMDLTYATRTGGGSYVEGVRQGLDDDVNRAQNAADAAQVTADAAREDFRRVVRIDTEGLHVGDSQTSNEVMIDSESVNVVLGGRKYSKFAGDYVQFGDYQLRRSVDGGLVFKKA